MTLANKWTALPFSTRWAICIWILLIGGVLGRVAFEKTTSQTVLPIYLEGANRWANSQWLYAPMPEGLDVYRNPPAIAVLTVPFTWMPPRVAALLWRTLFISLYLLGLFQFLRDVAPPLTPLRRAIFFILSAVLVLNAFNNAQFNLLIVSAALLGTAAAARGSWWASAFWLTLAAQVKIYPIALLGLICVVFPRRLIWRSVILATMVLAIPFVMGDTRTATRAYKWYGIWLDRDDRTDNPIERAPRGWTIIQRAFCDEIVPRHTIVPVAAITGIAFAAWVGYRAYIRKDEVPRLLRLAFCLGLVWMLVFGPGTEMNTYSMLAPVAAWLACRERSGVFAWMGVILLGAAIIRAGFPPNPATGMVALQPLGAIMLLIAVAFNSCYDRRSLPEPHP